MAISPTPRVLENANEKFISNSPVSKKSLWRQDKLTESEDKLFEDKLYRGGERNFMITEWVWTAGFFYRFTT